MENYKRYIYFHTLDYTGNYSTSGYTLPITPFTFIPVFDDGDGGRYSKQNILWDFGDGTFSTELTAVHNFSLPGWYNVKCYVLGEHGVGYEDKFSQLLLVKDYISDSLILSGSNNKTTAGARQNPYEVYRFNTWQNYDVLSSSGYTIKLHVTGNNSPMLNTELYNKDKWGHLKPTARFESPVFNSFTGGYDIVPVNEIKTTNDEIYVKYYKNELVLCDKNDDSSCFAGTSGSRIFYYIDDVPRRTVKVTDLTTETIFATFDTTKFKDLNSFQKKFPTANYSVLNNIFDSNSFSIFLQQFNSDHLSITSNGIDDDNNGNKIHTFDIFPEKFTGQKIPFVVRIKDKNERPSKGNPKLKLSSSSEISAGEVYIELKNSRNQKIEGIEFISNFGILSSEQYGGYFRGYFISAKELKNVSIFAKAIPVVDEQYLLDTTYTIISEPQFQKLHSIRVKTNIKNTKNKVLEDRLFDVEGLSGIYSSCIVSRRNDDATTTSYLWVVDADRDKIRKYNAEDRSGKKSLDLLYDNFIFPENSSPSDICADSKGNIWVSLYDSVSVVQIEEVSNFINPKMTIKSSLENQVIYNENTITPASIDTDYLDNLWVSYSNQLSSFVEKYDNTATFLFRTFFESGYQVTDITTDLNLNLWGIVKDNRTTSNVLSSRLDKVFKLNKDGTELRYYPISGSLWNITTDAHRNIWVTRNINEVTKINVLRDTFNTFVLNDDYNYDLHNYVSNLEGIACTTDDTIIVIDNRNHRLYYFDSEIETNGFKPSYIKLNSAGTWGPNKIQDKLNGYGDWNGFKFINKYQHVFSTSDIVQGYSNTFSIYDSSSGRYDIRKINENFDPIEQMKSYRFQEYLSEKDVLFNNFIGTAIGKLDSDPTELGKLVYEKISNFIDNNQNVDVCNITALRSMYEMMDEDFYTFNNIDYSIPADLNRLIDIFSIKFSKSKGSRNKFDENFDTKGYNSESISRNNGELIYGNNKGSKINLLTTVLTAGNNIVAYEKFSETYKILNTNLLSSAYVKFIDPVLKTYALSSYSENWGWGLALPDTYRVDQIENYYIFYNYLTGFIDLQTEGIINWGDSHTTIKENISSLDEWNEIKDNMITYSLAKGLGIIK
jgi:hypothetical protein